MSRFAFSRQPSAWIGLMSAAVAFGAVVGLHVPQGFEAAAAGLITAAGAAVTWTQVRPAAHSMSNDEAARRIETATAATRAEVAAKPRPVRRAAKKAR